jgi:hypothetical protein
MWHHAGREGGDSWPQAIGGCMIRSIAFGIAVVLSAATFAAAQSNDEQAACKDDALRVCGDAIPDRDQVARCLNLKKDQISQACRTVIARYFPEPVPQKATKRPKKGQGPVDLSPTASR